MPERVTNRFLNPIPAGPPKPPPYTYQEHPATRYHPTLPPRITRSDEEDAAAFAEGYANTPFPVPEPTPQQQAEKAGGDVGALLRLVNKLTSESEELVAENMRLNNLVEDSTDAVRIVELESEVRVLKAANKNLQNELYKHQKRRKAEPVVVETPPELKPEAEPDKQTNELIPAADVEESFLEALRSAREEQEAVTAAE